MKIKTILLLLLFTTVSLFSQTWHSPGETYTEALTNKIRLMFTANCTFIITSFGIDTLYNYDVVDYEHLICYSESSGPMTMKYQEGEILFTGVHGEVLLFGKSQLDRVWKKYKIEDNHEIIATVCHGESQFCFEHKRPFSVMLTYQFDRFFLTLSDYREDFIIKDVLSDSFYTIEVHENIQKHHEFHALKLLGQEMMFFTGNKKSRDLLKRLVEKNSLRFRIINAYDQMVYSFFLYNDGSFAMCQE